MSNNSDADSNRWDELQADRLLFGLTSEEQAEYDELAGRMPVENSEQFDRVVAAIDVAWSGPPQTPLPEHLRRKLRAQAEQELASRLAVVANVGDVQRPTAARASNYLPWLVAAACLALALFTWISNRPFQQDSPTVAQRRTELIASADDLVRAEWSAGTTPIAGAAGDVVWSSARQQGFMRFRGLPVNVPTDAQYQLWIFDKNQSDKTPVDGGVFDVGSDGEVVVPINAKLRVQEAFMFAITIEKPGGVVVSSREKLPLLAKVE